MKPVSLKETVFSGISVIALAAFGMAFNLPAQAQSTLGSPYSGWAPTQQVPGATFMPGTYPGYYPGAYPGAYPGSYPGAYPGVYPGVYPGMGTGLLPSAIPGTNTGMYGTINPMFAGNIGAPVPMGGANFSFRLGNVNCNMWRAPSGYYYPYYPGFSGFGQGLVNTIYVAPNSQEQPVAKQPPVSVQFSDTFKFLEDAKKDSKISDGDYEHLKRRATDIQKKERSYRIAQGGTLDSDYENEIRRDLDNLSNEIAQRVKQ